MAGNPQQRISDRHLQLVVEDVVSKKLGCAFREMSGLARNMSEPPQEAQLMILDMVRIACERFYSHTKGRIAKRN